VASVLRSKGKALVKSVDAKPYGRMSIVNEILFPEYMTFCDVQLLRLTSKKVAKLFDAQKQIVHFIASKLGLPRYGPSNRSTQYMNARLSTIIKARAIHISHRTDNPVKFKFGAECLYNWSSDYVVRLGECCEVCFCYPGDGKTLHGRIRMRRVPQGAKCVSYKMLCTDCVTVLEKAWSPDASPTVSRLGVQ
jgi:hypothetical protein